MPESKDLDKRGINMRVATTLVAASLLFGCAVEPTIEQGPDVQLTFDGLVPIKNSRFSNAWIDPDVDLTQYSKIIPGKAEFEFRAAKKTPEISSIRPMGNTSEFWISEKNREKLIDTVTGVFNEELAKSKHFTITEERGPDALILVGGLMDIVSRVPPKLAGSGEIYLSSVGEATLILELRDSLSGETIYRAVDRRRIERPGSAIEANTVTTWTEVRRWARRWALRLVDGLDSIHQQ